MAASPNFYKKKNFKNVKFINQEKYTNMIIKLKSKKVFENKIKQKIIIIYAQNISINKNVKGAGVNWDKKKTRVLDLARARKKSIMMTLFYPF